MRRWACDGLSFLTLDADVKEKLIADRDALHSMIELAKVGVGVRLSISNASREWAI